VSGEDLDDLLQIASRLMREATAPSSGLRSGQRWVYGRTARACRRCGGPIRSALTGATARRAYWCPRCQPAPGPR
jgi:formamidopyrimidine-DNA glycosylase